MGYSRNVQNRLSSYVAITVKCCTTHSYASLSLLRTSTRRTLLPAEVFSEMGSRPPARTRAPARASKSLTTRSRLASSSRYGASPPPRRRRRYPRTLQCRRWSSCQRIGAVFEARLRTWRGTSAAALRSSPRSLRGALVCGRSRSP